MMFVGQFVKQVQQTHPINATTRLAPCTLAAYHFRALFVCVRLAFHPATTTTNTAVLHSLSYSPIIISSVVYYIFIAVVYMYM